MSVRERTMVTVSGDVQISETLQAFILALFQQLKCRGLSGINLEGGLEEPPQRRPQIEDENSHNWLTMRMEADQLHGRHGNFRFINPAFRADGRLGCCSCLEKHKPVR